MRLTSHSTIKFKCEHFSQLHRADWFSQSDPIAGLRVEGAKERLMWFAAGVSQKAADSRRCSNFHKFTQFHRMSNYRGQETSDRKQRWRRVWWTSSLNGKLRFVLRCIYIHPNVTMSGLTLFPFELMDMYSQNTKKIFDDAIVDTEMPMWS